MERSTVEGRNILAALGSCEESESLKQILGADHWSLHLAHTFAEAEAALRLFSFGVVLCGSDFADGRGWKDVLNVIQRMHISPQLIVADRLADEALWAEVLNLGCYDLLAMPFEPREVLRVLPLAWDFWKRQSARVEAHPTTPKAQAWYEANRKALAASCF
jgi:DNA-binding NtrC family response regulator